ncbi:MAG: PEP-CTERM sorting domain-containing protein [Planctomycetes bacterium]|nr:PEP-CTERM sorting domain-containing protein [Planctomycetota bacterium]
MERRTKRLAAAAFGLAFAAGAGIAGSKDCGWLTEEPVQIAGDTANTDGCWEVLPLVTIGEQDSLGTDINQQELGYRPLGILDGMGAWKWSRNTVRVLANNELGGTVGYAYTLANGTSLTGARVAYFDIDRKSRKVCGAGLAYDRVYDRAGDEVTSASQINEGGSGGFDRFCSAHGFEKGEKGFQDDIYFCGEETANGQECALDVREGDLYVAPMLGRAAWENLCALENFKSDKIVLLIGDDTDGAPLYLYIGEKGAEPKDGDYSPPKFLTRNGLGYGRLFVWVSDDGDEDPSDFNGTGSSRKGKFKAITHFDPSQAGTSGWDSLGFASQDTQYADAFGLGAFAFSRPEDVSSNPKDGTQAVLVATGASGFAGGADTWGMTYIVDLDDCDLEEQLCGKLCDIDGIKARIRIVYDGNDAGGGQFSGPDYGLRSPDNLDWADDGKIYIQEDDAYGGFGQTSKIEASVWCLDPKTGKLVRILEIDRSAVPENQTDSDPTDIGDWESSGIIDVTRLFKRKKGETILLLNTQAHSLRDGGLEQDPASSESADLVQGGQLLIATRIDKKCKDWDKDCGD